MILDLLFLLLLSLLSPLMGSSSCCEKKGRWFFVFVKGSKVQEVCRCRMHLRCCPASQEAMPAAAAAAGKKKGRRLPFLGLAAEASAATPPSL